jgi:hypothetical protein
MTSLTRYGATVGLVAVVYTILQSVIGGLLLSSVPTPPGNALPFFLASNVLVSAVAVALASRLPARGWRRSGVLFLALWGIPANNLVEAVFFSLDIPRSVLPLLFANAFCASLVLAVVVDRLVPAAAPAGTAAVPRTLASWVARGAACDVGYIAAYMVAGMFVWPYVQGFYSSRPLPDLRAVLSMQVFRGLVFTAIVAMLVRRLSAGRLAAAILVGVTLSLVGGVIPLMVPNPFMPAAIRLAHMIETASSNLLWGFGAALALAASAMAAPNRARAA